MSVMEKSLVYVKQNPKRIFVWGVVLIVVVGLIVLYGQSGFSLEEFITQLWDKYVETWGYLILFCWGILEGELGLIFAGLAVHDGKMNLF